MMEFGTTAGARDILSKPWPALLVFWLPAVAIAITARSSFSGGWRTVVWTVSLTTLGIACIANAIRCRRVHCYATGPFFLIMAVAALLYGLGIVRLGASGWNLIGLTILIGGIALCCVPEFFLGKYRSHPAADHQ
jgi:hypothetical protein